MKNNDHKAAAQESDFLVTVARSIGSTLGAVAAKVSSSPRASHRPQAGRKRVRKQASASRRTRHTSRKVAARKSKNRKKSLK